MCIMVTKPMKGDGPQEIFEGDPPITLGEMVATCEDDHNLMLALAMSRAWPEGVPESELEPWQRIGPDILWMFYRGDFYKQKKIHDEAVRHVSSLRWVDRKRVKMNQVERACADAIEKLVTGQTWPSDIAAMSVGCRKETYLDLRAEATALLVNCMSVAQFGVEVALGMRPEPRTTSKMA